MARSGVALSFAVLLAVLEIGNCLRCYQCNSQSSKDCADPINVNKLHLVDCMLEDAINYNQLYLSSVLPRDVMNVVRGAPRYCHKLVMKNGAVVRTCLETNPSNLNTTCQFLGEPTRNLNDATRQVTHCSVCDKEACNGAGAMALSLPLTIITFFITYLYFKH